MMYHPKPGPPGSSPTPPNELNKWLYAERKKQVHNAELIYFPKYLFYAIWHSFLCSLSCALSKVEFRIPLGQLLLTANMNILGLYGVTEEGIRRTRKGIQQSRELLDIDSMDPAIVDAAIRLAETLLSCNPADLESWKLDLGPFKDIALAHRRQWDHRTHGDKRGNVRIAIQDSLQYPSRMLMKSRNRLYASMGNKIGAVYVDTFKHKSGKPDWSTTKGIWPPTDTRDQSYRMGIEKTLSNFYLKENMSLTVARHYFSREYCAEVLTNSGLVTYQDAMTLLSVAWLGMLQVWRPIGELDENVGRELHTTYKGREGLVLAALACQGSFQGERGWRWFNQALAQGAWPWLGAYPKSYAKTIFLAMACLFAVVRHGASRPGLPALVLALAAKLVDGNCFGAGPIQIRLVDSLTDDKILYDPKPKKPKEAPQADQAGEAAALAEPPAPTWTYSSAPAASNNGNLPPCQFLILGQKCNHGADLHFTGRIKLVSSLADLPEAILKRESIAVTTTFGDAKAVNEVEVFVRQQRVLTVRRNEEQCTACAVKLAHAVGALVVIA